jgi:DNA-binding MarR family transcriptional regulator
MKKEQIVNTSDFASSVHRLVDKIAKNNRVYEEACITFFGVTTSQGGTLLSLPLDNTLKMNELSNIIGVDNSTMTRMIDQLVEKGLVTRRTGEKDRRQVQIGLTPEGRKLHQELAGALEKFYQDSLERIPENERAAIKSSLETVNAAIGKGLEECCKRYCKS